MKRNSVKKMVTLAMFSAIAYLMVNLIRIPVVLFLKYEPKDVIITIGGFLFGPMASFIISGVVSLLEMVTISDTGPIGCLMNLISTCSFACTAAVIYKKKHSLFGAVLGLSIGVILMTAVMLGWNYILTPLYMNQNRADVAAMLVPMFLPFNLIKGCLNAAITSLLYRPLVQGLRRAGLLPESKSGKAVSKVGKLLFYGGAVLLILASVAAVYLLK